MHGTTLEYGEGLIKLQTFNLCRFIIDIIQPPLGHALNVRWPMMINGWLNIDMGTRLFHAAEPSIIRDTQTPVYKGDYVDTWEEDQKWKEEMMTVVGNSSDSAGGNRDNHIVCPPWALLSSALASVVGRMNKWSGKLQ